MKRLMLVLFALSGIIGFCTSVLAQGGPPKDNIIDGTL